MAGSPITCVLNCLLTSHLASQADSGWPDRRASSEPTSDGPRGHSDMTHKLPNLPYDYGALEPHIDTLTMTSTAQPT